MGALQSVLNFFLLIGEFIVNILTGLIQMLAFIPKSLNFLLYAFDFLPPMLLVFAVAMVTVNIVYLIIGR